VDVHVVAVIQPLEGEAGPGVGVYGAHGVPLRPDKNTPFVESPNGVQTYWFA